MGECKLLATKDGYCRAHHPEHRMKVLKNRLEKIHERLEDIENEFHENEKLAEELESEWSNWDKES
jgi:hypothetical protein